MADLQELFSRLKSPAASASDAANSTPGRQQPSIWAQPQTQYQQPSVSSPLFSPPIQTPNPQHPMSVLSPNMASSANTPVPDSKANNLLNLLKFNSNQQSPQPAALAAMQNIANPGRSSSMGQSSAPHHAHNTARVVSASDLVASFQPRQPGVSSLRVGMASPQVEIRPEGLGSPPMDTQNFLLNLLTRPKPAVPDVSPSVESPAPQAPASTIERLVAGLRDATLDQTATRLDTSDREATPARMFGSVDSREHTPFEAPPTAKKGPVFTYVNPFEQLSASSPQPAAKPEARAVTPKVDILKHQRDVSSSADGEAAPPQSKSRKLRSTAEPATPSSLSTQPSTVDAAVDGAAGSKSQSVQEALTGVGEKVDKQVERALAQADKVSATHPSPLKEDQSKNASAEEIADSWESADAEEGLARDEYAVYVYNFPMKPFVSIEINKGNQATPIRPQSLMDIARLKKDFEQIDRTLVTASVTHIVYTIPKDGGFRVIRQDSGKDKKVFGTSQERISNVQISSAAGPQKDTEAILATGVNGSVFWTTVTKGEGEAFDDYNLESQGFILPPVPVQDDNTSGSPVKTRAKMSSRHAEFFAISRGKSIYVISPMIARQQPYTDKKTRIVDNDKYLEEHCLKIHTGKAGKDFAFSEDDSLLVSLDKSGRIKFWDIREIAEIARDNTTAQSRPPFEQKAPLLTLTSSLPMEKATPSSIMFVDKERPCVKGVALRYLIVGLKQNHILQLWDLGLNKPVQEIHFPHDKDSDAICSIAYHPKTGILALGHPTRNSIYFIHLSAPRYNIQSMDQARYVTMLASQDPSLARPESTAIMSGIRELSFASKGQLRSVDMLKTPVSSEASDNVLFELYVMHSKGVACINMGHEDLGWSSDNKVLHPVDAEGTGYISVNEIRVTATTTPSDVSGDAATKPAKAVPTSSPSPQKAEAPKPAALVRTSVKQETAAAPNGSAKAEKPKKSVPEPSTAVDTPATNPAILTPASYALAAGITPPHKRETSPAKTVSALAPVEQPSATPNGNVSLGMDSISKTISEAFSGELDALYRKFDDDKRVQDAAAAAKQDAVLRLVSSTLTDNVEKSLTRIVSTNMQSTVLPAITEITSGMVDRRLTEVLTQQLTTLVPKEIKASLPSAIALAMQDKEIHRTISEQTAAKLTPLVEQTFNSVLRNSIIPNFTNLAMTTTQKAVGDVERRFAEQLHQAEAQRRGDNAKIEQLTNLILGLSKTVQEMAVGQGAFQEQVLKLQRQVGASAQEESNKSAASTDEDVVQSIEDQELQAITDMMTRGGYEEATIMWLQSARQGELFDKLFVRINPQYLQRLSPLVALSVSAALTSSFDQHVTQRLDWLSSVLSHINLQDLEIREVAPKIMDVLQQRMSGAYMQIAEVDPKDPALRKVAGLARQISEIKRVTE